LAHSFPALVVEAEEESGLRSHQAMALQTDILVMTDRIFSELVLVLILA
jgi:hypothetical protein